MMPLLCRPILITSANRTLAVTEGATPANAVLATGTYWLLGDGSASCILTALKTALETATASTNTYTLTLVLDAGFGVQGAKVRVTRATGADAFTLRWTAGATTLPRLALGFAAADVSDTAGVIEGTLSPDLVWFGGEVLREDERPRTAPVFAQRTSAGLPHAGRRGAARRGLRWSVVMVPVDRVKPDAIPADTARAFASFWELAADGSHLRLGLADYDTLVVSWLGAWVFDLATMESFDPPRLSEASGLYSWPLAFWQVPA